MADQLFSVIGKVLKISLNKLTYYKTMNHEKILVGQVQTIYFTADHI